MCGLSNRPIHHPFAHCTLPLTPEYLVPSQDAPSSSPAYSLALNCRHWMVKLLHFIAYVLHRTKLHPSITFAAPVFLQCPKAHFPTARRLLDHHLFVSVFMLASKVICDKLWLIVVQGMFQSLCKSGGSLASPFRPLITLVVSPDSACDVCLECYTNGVNIPHAISCSHVFCQK